MTLLVIEDHPVLRSRLMEHFTRAGFAADAAPDGASARDYLDNRMYDVVILDLGLPDMDGIDLLARRDGGMQGARAGSRRGRLCPETVRHGGA